MKGLPECGPDELLLPQTVHITPSKINPWRDVRDEDQRYTRFQLRRLREQGIDPDTVPDVIVRDKVNPFREMYTAGRPLVYLIPCPIIEGKGQQLTVLSPDGSRKIVQPDGTKGRPKKGARRGR